MKHLVLTVIPLGTAFGLLAMTSCHSEHEATRVVAPREDHATPFLDAARVAFADRGDGFMALGSRHTAEITPQGKLLLTGSRAKESFHITTTFVGRDRGRPEGDLTLAKGDSGKVILSRRVGTESFENRERGVEQSWTFDKVPPGEGDLLVRVHPEGLMFSREDKAGLHFQQASSRALYGHGMWIDAHGLRREVLAHMEAGDIVMRVPSALLEESAYPAVLDPLIAPESDLNLNPPVGGKLDSATSTAVASDGSNFLVAWTDRRNTDYQTYGAIVDNNGPTIAGGFPISSVVSGHKSVTPRVAWNGANYLVVWEDYVATDGGDVYGAFVSPTGTPSAPFVIAKDSVGAPAPFAQSAPAVSCDAISHDCFVVWTDERDTNHEGHIEGALVTSSGVGNNVIVEGAATGSFFLDPTVAWTGNRFVVLYAKNAGADFDLYGASYGGNGSVIDPAKFVVGLNNGSLRAPQIAVVSPTALAVACLGINLSEGLIFGNQFALVGIDQNLTFTGAAATTITDPKTFGVPSIAWNKEHLVFSFQKGTLGAGDAGLTGTLDVFVGATKWNLGPQTFDPLNFVSVEGVTNADMAPLAQTGIAARSGSPRADLLAVWSDGASASLTVRGGFLRASASGPPLSGALPDGGGDQIFSIKTKPASADQASFAVDPTSGRMVAAWETLRSGPNFSDDRRLVSVAPFSWNGTQWVLSDTPRLFHGGDTPLQRPRVVFDGTSFVLAWDEHPAGGKRAIGGAYLSLSSGGLLGERANGRFSLTSAGAHHWMPYLVSVGSQGILLAHSQITGPDNALVSQAHVSRLTYGAGGVNVSAPASVGNPVAVGTRVGIRVESAAFSQTHNEVLFAFSAPSGASNDDDIYVARANPSGTWMDTSPIPLLVNAAIDQYEPSLAFGNGTYLMSWTDGRNLSSNQNYDTFIAAIAPGQAPAFSPGTEKQLTPPSAVSSGGQFSSATTFDGTHFFVAWLDERHGTSAYELFGLFVRAGVGTTAPVPEQWNANSSLSGYGIRLDSARTGLSMLRSGLLGEHRIGVSYTARARSDHLAYNTTYFRAINGVGAPCASAGPEPTGCFVGFSCSSPTAGVCVDSLIPDAGTGDATVSEGGTDAASVLDASDASDAPFDAAGDISTDAMLEDASDAMFEDAPDAMLEDASDAALDAEDARVPDDGSIDAAVRDSAPRDARSSSDVEAVVDAGRQDATQSAMDSFEAVPAPNSGCGCRVAPRSSSLTALLAPFALALLRRRKR